MQNETNTQLAPETPSVDSAASQPQAMLTVEQIIRIASETAANAMKGIVLNPGKATSSPVVVKEIKVQENWYFSIDLASGKVMISQTESPFGPYATYSDTQNALIDACSKVLRKARSFRKSMTVK
jgi:hypothetical protein